MVLGRGARAWVRAGTVAIGAALLGPALAGSFAALFISLVLLGVCAGFIDMLENAQAAELERIAGRPLINGFHGFWDLGTPLCSLLPVPPPFARLPPPPP